MNDPITDVPPRRPTPERHVFETTDLETGRAFMNAAYGTSLRMRGNEQEQLVRHSRYDLGLFCLDDVTLSMDTEYDSDPLDRLAVIQLHSGWTEHRPAGAGDSILPGDQERIGPGDINIIAQPDQPFSAVASNLDFSGVLLDVPLVMQAAGIAEDLPSGPLRFSRLEPPTPGAADRWSRTFGYVHDLLATNPEAMSEPLVVGDTARLLAASALETFPNSALAEPTSKDTSDATPATVGKAVAFIEDNAHTDIGLTDIAAAISVSPRALQLAFTRHHDTSLRGHLRRVRLDRAHFDLLAADPTTDATVAGVAARWGFAKPGTFRSLYKAIYGVSPSEALAI
jgi:AraC-like DNA-binding protein